MLIDDLKEKETNSAKIDDIPLKVNVEIDSEINELFAKTKVTQKLTNSSEKELELKIYVSKKNDLIFSSFNSKIGNSIFVKSKVIKKEKAEKKYTDNIAGGNAAIFVCEDPYDENNIIINMGNIPAKEEVIFISEFIQLIEVSKSYEFEFFRNLPIFQGENTVYQNSELIGKVHIKTNRKINNIEKEILMKELNIVEEKYENKNKNSYFVSYKIDKLPEYNKYNSEYIASSKIYFELENDKPIIFTQVSSLDKNENNYIIQYKLKTQKSDEKNQEENPALFIFLLDQSGSMGGESIKIATKALVLFLQSLPAKSYYQIIGFGSSYKKYDKTPKIYNEKNIKETIKVIEGLSADLGGTDIYKPLKDIYDSYKTYNKINLPKIIFLLTDGAIEDKDKTLKLIEKNSQNFTIFSIGIGGNFDEDLIKNAGILGKGNYNFCKDINKLNSIIAQEINAAISPFVTNLNITTSLDKENIIKNNIIPNIMRDNEIINLKYIINNKDKKNLIKIEILYLENGEKTEKKYEIKPEEISEGEELSKMIINNYILNSPDITDEEKIKLALKYQILTKETSLFAEIELSEKITEEMKTKIIGDKDKNIILKKQVIHPIFENRYDKVPGLGLFKELFGINDMLFESYNIPIGSLLKNSAFEEPSPFEIAEKKNKIIFGKKTKSKCALKEKSRLENVNKKRGRPKKLEEESELNLDEKEGIMTMIKTQNFVKGFWNENKQTKIIKEKYKKEYDLIKGIKDKKISDDVAMTIIIIYFICKEHSELLKELSRIIKKAKLFIKNETKSTYDNIIKEIGI